MRHADMATTTKTLLPCPPKEQSAKTNSAALRSKRKGTRIRSPPCFAIHLWSTQQLLYIQDPQLCAELLASSIRWRCQF